MKIHPLHDRIVIERMEEERISTGGIVIPESATKKPIRGKVIAVGKGKISNNGKVRPIDVNVGDDVLFSKYAGTEFKFNDKKYIIMKEDDIFGVIIN